MDVLDDNDLLFIEKFLRSFKSLGGNELGSIKYQELKTALIQKNGMSEEDISQLLRDEHSLVGDELDYVNLCISVLSNKVIFNRVTSENKKSLKSTPRINSRTFTRKKPHTRPSNLTDGNNKISDLEQNFVSQCLKGSLFNIGSPQDLLGNCYKLEIIENSPIEIYAKTMIDCTSQTPVEILLFLDNSAKNKPLVEFSSAKNAEGYCIVKCNLKPGIYSIVPVISSWNNSINNIQEEMSQPHHLMDVSDDGQLKLTPVCERALRTVFDSIDIDGNGLINQLEFDLFIQHISGETALDEWFTVEDNFAMESNQLTFEGFLELYKLALETDPDDVISMFQKMGMNESLQLENAIPFHLIINSNTTKLLIEPLPIAPFHAVMDKILRKTTVEQGFCNKVKNMNDLFLYTHSLPHRVTIVIQNQSHCKVTVRLDCSKSENCFSHWKDLDHSVEVPPRISVVGHHLFPSNPNSPWNVECMESVIT